MGMDPASLTLSLLFGLLGTAFFMYGKSAGQFVFLGAGAALMVCPYFIPNIIASAIVCLLISAVPFVIRAE
jgi:hypothetical protein